MDLQHPHNYRKLHAALLVILLLLFFAVYHRRFLLSYARPLPAQTDTTPNARRTSLAWNREHALSAINLVKNGDLVVRSGSDAISALFKKTNTRDKTWSHAGIIFIENGYPFVYHCIGNAADPEAVLTRDSLTAYIAPYNNLAYAVYRYKLKAASLEKLHDIAIRYYKERRTFDPHFDLQTDSALYCTEFVYKAVIEATGDKQYLPVTHAAHFDFIAVDNLFARKDIKLVCKIGYMQ